MKDQYLSRSISLMSMQRRKIAIIGGGITGLSTAYFLQEKAREKSREIECLLIEGENRLGGKIRSERIHDFIIEGGPDSFITQKKWGVELCRRLDLSKKFVQTHPVEKSIYILSNGKLVPMPEGFNLMIPSRLVPFALTPLISLPGKIRMGMDLLISKNNSAEDESIASFVRRRLGEEAVRTFAEPILGGIFAGDAEKLSIKASFPQFLALEKKYGSLIRGMWLRQRETAKKDIPKPELSLFVTLKEGLSSLVTSIQNRLKEVSIVSGNPVTRVVPIKNQYEIVVGDERHLVDGVVITTKTTTAADWVEKWDASLASQLREISYVSTATVSLGFRKDQVDHPLNGFGFVVPRGENRSINAATWSSTKFPGRAPEGHVLIRTFLGGAHQQDLIDLDDSSLISVVREDLKDIMGIDAQPVVARAFRWIKASPQYHIGHLDRVSRIEAQTQKHAGLFLVGAAYRGVGIPDCIAQAHETAGKILEWISTEDAAK
ncbi:MAG: protoporphyrinogen oxidase [Nitrospiria bacterium]